MKKAVSSGLLTAMLFVALIGCTQPPANSPTTLPTPAPTSTPDPSPTTSLTLLPPQSTLPSDPSPSPSPTELPHVSFAVIGDFGSAGPDLAAVAALIDSWQVDLILTTGDNNYRVGSPFTIDENIGQYFHEYIFPYQGTYGEGAQQNRF